MNPVRKRRLIFVILVLLAASLAAVFISMALEENINYMYSPTEIHDGKASNTSKFRLGGVVCTGSIERISNTFDVTFKVTDGVRYVPVQYSGILPDMFKEGTSIIATGKMQSENFVASEVLAKHDETYMPAEVAKNMSPEMLEKMSKGPATHELNCGEL